MKKITLDKHCIIVTAGCSFTKPHAGNATWATLIKDELDQNKKLSLRDGDTVYEYPLTTVLDHSRVSSGNYFIVEDTLAYVNAYMKNRFDYGALPEPHPSGQDVYVLIQLSSLNRVDIYDSDTQLWNHAPKVTRKYDEVKDIWEPLAEIGQKTLKYFQDIGIPHEEKQDKKRGSEAKFIHGMPMYDYWKKYFGYFYTEERHFGDLLRNIITVQHLFQKHNIKYRFFSGWDIFTNSETIVDDTEVIMTKNTMWSETERYTNTDLKLLIESYPHLRVYWDNIDWDTFWFFENDFVHVGGMNEWIKYNLSSEDWYHSKNDPHPSSKAQKKFMDVVIKELLSEMFEEKLDDENSRY